jgi:hypothetical protein
LCSLNAYDIISGVIKNNERVIFVAREIYTFPIIEFHDIYGNIHAIKEITETQTFDGDKKIKYTTYDDEEFHLIIKER